MAFHSSVYKSFSFLVTRKNELLYLEIKNDLFSPGNVMIPAALNSQSCLVYNSNFRWQMCNYCMFIPGTVDIRKKMPFLNWGGWVVVKCGLWR